MLHRCIEGEKVGDDSSKVVDIDRCHDPSPGGIPTPPGERGREPPSFFFFLGLPLDWRRVPPVVHGLLPAEGREPLRDWISLSVLFCFGFPKSDPSPFLKFPEIRNSDWAEILTQFCSVYYLSCRKRREATTLQGLHKPARRA